MKLTEEDWKTVALLLQTLAVMGIEWCTQKLSRLLFVAPADVVCEGFESLKVSVKSVVAILLSVVLVFISLQFELGVFGYTATLTKLDLWSVVFGLMIRAVQSCESEVEKQQKGGGVSDEDSLSLRNRAYEEHTKSPDSCIWKGSGGALDQDSLQVKTLNSSGSACNLQQFPEYFDLFWFDNQTKKNQIKMYSFSGDQDPPCAVVQLRNHIGREEGQKILGDVSFNNNHRQGFWSVKLDKTETAVEELTIAMDGRGNQEQLKVHRFEVLQVMCMQCECNTLMFRLFQKDLRWSSSVALYPIEQEKCETWIVQLYKSKKSAIEETDADPK